MNYGGEQIITQDLKLWVEDRIRKNPEDFGTDEGFKPLFVEWMRLQGAECVGREHVQSLTTVERVWRAILAANPQWDKRTSTGKARDNPGQLTIFFDAVEDEVARKTLRYLTRHPQNADWPASRIIKSLWKVDNSHRHIVEDAVKLFRASKAYRAAKKSEDRAPKEKGA